MAQNFEKVIRYKCGWCGKLFSTNCRHKCKFDPDKHNCLSCKHCRGVKSENREIDTWQGSAIKKVNLFECDLGNGTDDDYTYLQYVKEYNWSLECPDWEEIPEYVGSKSYAEHSSDLKWRIEIQRMSTFF